MTGRYEAAVLALFAPLRRDILNPLAPPGTSLADGLAAFLAVVDTTTQPSLRTHSRFGNSKRIMMTLVP